MIEPTKRQSDTHWFVNEIQNELGKTVCDCGRGKLEIMYLSTDYETRETDIKKLMKLEYHVVAAEPWHANGHNKIWIRLHAEVKTTYSKKWED